MQEFSRGKSLVARELKTAEKELVDAKDTFEREKYKWATIQSYYSMFHSARALLYSKNYRERSHYCLIVALRVLYVDKKILPSNLVESLQNGKTLRENADYYDEWSKEGAESLLNVAEKFLSKSRQLASPAI
ncbi:HEPN domain-containing protein [Candidatus Omnitrophota bacterium]